MPVIRKAWVEKSSGGKKDGSTGSTITGKEKLEAVPGGSARTPAVDFCIDATRRESRRRRPMVRKAQLGRPGPSELVVEGPGQSVSTSHCTGAQRAGSAQGNRSSALLGSVAMIGTFSHQPDALTCHP